MRNMEAKLAMLEINFGISLNIWYVFSTSKCVMRALLPVLYAGKIKLETLGSVS